MKHIYNFSAGPATLPQKALEVMQHELLNYDHSGMSVLELSHRSKTYDTIHNEAKENLRNLLSLNQDQEILFIQGGASLQFTMVPMNLGKAGLPAYYVDGGTWGSRALEEGKLVLGELAVCLSSSKDSNYTTLPNLDNIPDTGAYIHITANNTIEGTMHTTFPKTKIPLIVDMSSNILSVDIDYNQFDLIYAGAQKNLGPSGVTLVIIKKALLDSIDKVLPSMLDYRIYQKSNSLFNTPPTFSIYALNEVLKWVKGLGGVQEMDKRARQKALLLYDTLDKSKLFKTPVKGKERSLTNIPFFTHSDTLNDEFLAQANEMGLINLKGHRLVGGMRASIYNAMPLEGVMALSDFIKQFEKEHKRYVQD